MKKVLALMLMIAPFSVNAAEHGGKAVKSKATAAQAAEDAQQLLKLKANQPAEHGGKALQSKPISEHGGTPVKKKIDEHAGTPVK